MVSPFTPETNSSCVLERPFKPQPNASLVPDKLVRDRSLFSVSFRGKKKKKITVIKKEEEEKRKMKMVMMKMKTVGETLEMRNQSSH